MPNNSATINLVMGSFVENPNDVPAFGPPGGPYIGVSSFAFASDGGGNPLNADGQVSISGTTVTVKRAKNGTYSIPLTFNVSCADKVNYNPLAMVFQQTAHDADASGNTNFTDRTPSNQSITVKNQCTHRGKKGGPGGNQAPAWKFYIRVTQTSTGKLGWIDPIVENQDQD